MRVRGHFGEFLQGRLGPGGPLALVSVPCSALWVDVGAPGQPGLIDAPRLVALCGALGLTVPDDLPTLRAIMPPGGGAGSSTAALVAVALSLGWQGPPETLARACVAAEGASDPLMFPRPERLLFAPREGRVLQALPALPEFEVVGGFWGPVQRTQAEDLDFPDIGELVAGWVKATDLAEFAALSSRSATRTLAHRGLTGDPTATLARETGALGWLIAHTGNARGLIFAPGQGPAHAEATLARAGFSGVIRFAGGGI